MSATCVEGVVGVIRRDGRLLAIKRAEGVPAPGAWCFPGGAIEAGETREQALIREMREELGVAVRPGVELWHWLRPDGCLLLYWLMAGMADAEVIQPNPAEVADVRWVTPAEFRALEPALPSNLLFLEHYESSCEQG